LLGWFSQWSLALWSAQGTAAGLGVTPATVGFAVTFDGQTDVATGSDGTDASVGFTLGPDEATALMAAPDQVLALPFDVDLAVSGKYGMTFDMTLPVGGPDTVLGLATWTAFQVGAAGCTVEAAEDPATPPVDADGQIIGVEASAVARPAGTTVNQPWCLVLEYSPSPYHNTVTVTGSNALGTELDPATGSWTAGFDPDPAGQPVLAVKLTHQLTQPAEEVG